MPNAQRPHVSPPTSVRTIQRIMRERACPAFEISDAREERAASPLCANRRQRSGVREGWRLRYSYGMRWSALGKFLRITTVSFIALSILTLFVAINESNPVLRYAHPANPTSENTIPLSVRGVGTVYLTKSEWTGIAPYWNVFYVCLGLGAASLTGNLIYIAYQKLKTRRDQTRDCPLWVERRHRRVSSPRLLLLQ
jgi:hypothetical protein